MTVAEFNIPDSSKEFLAEIGMPHDVDWSLTFETSSQALLQFHDYSDLRIIGYDDMMPLCLDEQHGGKVVVVEPSHDNVRFVNSCVEMLGYFLMVYQQCRLQGHKLSDDEEIVQLIDFTEHQMIQLDEIAMSDTEYYWSVIIEQVRAGLL